MHSNLNRLFDKKPEQIIRFTKDYRAHPIERYSSINDCGATTINLFFKQVSKRFKRDCFQIRLKLILKFLAKREWKYTD